MRLEDRRVPFCQTEQIGNTHVGKHVGQEEAKMECRDGVGVRLTRTFDERCMNCTPGAAARAPKTGTTPDTSTIGFDLGM